MRKVSLIRTVVAMAVALSASAGAMAAAPLQVQSIQIAGRDASTRVDVRLTRTGEYQLFSLSGPDRVVLDISSAALGPSALPLPAPAGSVRQVRVAHRPGGSLRIVFDMNQPVHPQGSLTRGGAQTRLLIDLRPATFLAGGPQNVPSAATVPVPAPAPAAANTPVPAVESSRVQPEPAPTPSAADTHATAGPYRKVRELVIAVDAGHGGHDPGARGPHGVWEKDVTLAISRRLAALLDQEPGMRGMLTRSGDQFVVLRQRMERARAANADLFVSIHADAARDREARGSTVYVLSEKGATDEAARRLAARENAADLIGGVELGNKDPVLASVLMDLSQNASISSSISVGDSILDEIRGLGRLHRGTVQQAPFMVLKSPDVPSVLVETAFITNPEDEQNLDSAEYQDHLAQAILAGIRKYFRATAPRETVVASARADSPGSLLHVIQRGDTLSTVANRYGVTVQRIRAENGLRSDGVSIGQRLRIPGAQT